MSHENDRTPDHGWIDPDGSRVLAETLTAMAAGVDPYSATGPAATLGHMAGRVRRRRTVKLGAAGGGALAVAGILAFGGPQLTSFHDASPVLPGDPSTSVSASPDPTEDPILAGDDLLGEEGLQPELLEGTSLACGVPWSEVEVAGDLALRADGPLATTAARDDGGNWTYSQSLAVIAVDDGGEVPADDLNWPTLVWTDADDRVVNAGGWYLGSFGNPENTSGTTEASTTGSNECAAEGVSSQLPDGTYEVRPMTLRHSDGALIAGDAQPVVISGGESSIADGGLEVAEPIKLPEIPDEEIVAQRGINSVVLDRTGERQRWVSSWGDLETAERLATGGTAFEVRGRCTVTDGPQDGEDSVVATVRGVWTGEAGNTAPLVCDGKEHVILWELYHGEDPFSVDGEVGVVLTAVADTVAQVDVRMIPAPS
jgi:hypothetical protein